MNLSPPSAQPELDAKLARLRDRADAFAKLSIRERIALAQKMLDGAIAHAEESVRAGCEIKGFEFSSVESGEEWLAGPTQVVRNLRLLIDTLERLDRKEPTISPSRVRTRPDGRVVVDVMPTDGMDKILFGGFSGEVWMLPGTTAKNVVDQAGSFHRSDPATRKGHLVLVLGAGNVQSIPPMDALYKMFVEGKVCLVKMNPVNERTGPPLERAFASAIDAGYLAYCYGGADVGAYLVNHASVDEVHITGSDKTHDIMVWGPPGPDRDARKQKNDPILKKEISSELGNVTPVIVVPGPYSPKELYAAAESIASAMTNNASFNCNAAKMIVTPKGWAQRDALIAALSDVLGKVPVRKAYYPGAEQRYSSLTEGHPDVRKIGGARPGTLPWTIIVGLDENNRAEKCFTTEPFCSVISEVPVGSDDPATFLEAATRFCNDTLWGTLAATIMIHPQTQKDARVAPALDRAIQDLRYGAVAINHWPALAYGFVSPPWGGHPSATLENIQSGKGWVHNTYMLEGIEKTVIRGPLIPNPRPVWYPNHKTVDRIGRRLVAMSGYPSLWKLPGIIFNALRG